LKITKLQRSNIATAASDNGVYVTQQTHTRLFVEICSPRAPCGNRTPFFLRESNPFFLRESNPFFFTGIEPLFFYGNRTPFFFTGIEPPFFLRESNPLLFSLRESNSIGGKPQKRPHAFLATCNL
jgi:hypothetical protein